LEQETEDFEQLFVVCDSLLFVRFEVAVNDVCFGREARGNKIKDLAQGMGRKEGG
jgi:hypothetical protein